MAGNKIIVGLAFISLISLAATGCSDDSNPVAAPPVVDTAPPVAVSDMDGEYNSAFDAVLVSWTENNVDSDLDGYVLSREHNGQTVELISDPVMTQMYQDGTASDGLNTYHVYAVDQAGNESAVTSMTIYKGGERSPSDPFQQ